MFHEITVSPFSVNVLDLLGETLYTQHGTEVIVTQSGLDFVVRVDGEIAFESGDNLSVSGYLNSLPVGRMTI